MAILRKELDSSGGNAPMSSLSVRVKWGQGELAQLGNFRTFLKKHPEVFKLESNTVHLANFTPVTSQETAALDATANVRQATSPAAAERAAPSMPAATAALSKAAAAAVMSKAAVAPAVTGMSKGGSAVAAAPAPSGLSKAVVAPAVAGHSKALTPGGAGAVQAKVVTSKGLAQAMQPGVHTSKAGVQTPKSSTPALQKVEVPAAKKRAFGDSTGDGPEAKAARKVPTPASSSEAAAGVASKAKAFEGGSASSNSYAPKEASYAPKASSYMSKEEGVTEANGFGGWKGASGKSASGNHQSNKAFAKSSEPRGVGAAAKPPGAAAPRAAPPPTKVKSWAALASAAPPHSAQSKGAAVAAAVWAPAPETGSEEEPEVVAEHVAASASFVPKGGVSKGSAAAPRKAGAAPLGPLSSCGLVKQGSGPGRGPVLPPHTLSKAPPKRPGLGAATEEPGGSCGSAQAHAPTQPLTSLAGRLAPLKADARAAAAAEAGSAAAAQAAAQQAPSKHAAVRALEPKAPQQGPEPTPALVVSQAKRPAPQTVAQPTKLPPQAASPEADNFQPPARKRWQEDALSHDELTMAISGCKACGIELELIALAKRISPTEEYQRAYHRCVALLRSAVAVAWGSKKGVPAPSLELCGSLAQGTDLDGSDVDIALRLAPGLSGEDRDSCVQELRERLQTPPQSAFLSVSDPLHLYPHAEASLTLELKGSHPRTIAHVLLVQAPATQAERSRPLSVDLVIKQLCDTFELARDLIRLVKLWAVNHGLSGQHEGYMNGVAWALLTVFYMQKEKLVPPYAALTHGAVFPEPTLPQLSALLRGFFEFLAARDGHVQRGLSVIHAQEYRAPSGVLFLEDPAEFHETRQQRNLAESIGESQWARIIDEARKAAERLMARPQRWFHWAEVFDPRELPPDKIARLQPLARVVAAVGLAGLQPEAGSSMPVAAPVRAPRAPTPVPTVRPGAVGMAVLPGAVGRGKGPGAGRGRGV